MTNGVFNNFYRPTDLGINSFCKHEFFYAVISLYYQHAVIPWNQGAPYFGVFLQEYSLF